MEARPLNRQPAPALPNWVPRTLMLAGLIVVATLMLRVTYPPFQDFPNNLHVLTLDRAFDAPEVSRYFQRPQHFVFGYSVCSLLNRATSGWVSEKTALRWMFVLAALGLPLGVSRVARVVGVEPFWPGFLALPLALSWPLKMGFIQYSLALAASLFAIAAAVRTSRQPEPKRGLELALWICLTYMAHALALGFIFIGMGLSWLDAKRSKVAVAVVFGLALLPAGTLLMVDLAHDVFRAIPETAVSLQQHSLEFRAPALALAHLFTRSYGVTDAGALLWYAPLMALLVLASASALRHPRDLWRGETSYLLWAVPVMIAVCIVSPETTERVYFIGSRLAVMAMALVTVLATVTIARATPRIQWLAVGVTVLALAGVGSDLVSRSSAITGILGVEGPERVSGRFLTAKVGPCADSDEKYWGRYESERHLWAYALALDGVTPYLFAWSRYHPVQYRGEIYSQQLRAPQESINGDRLLGGSCEEANRERLLGATSWIGFDGALITGRPKVLAELDGHPSLRGARHLAPGMLLTPPQSGSSTELQVEMDPFESALHLGEGWNDSELTGDRDVRWSEGSVSEVLFDLTPLPRPYELLLTLYPYPAVMPQDITVTLNGHSLEPLKLRNGWTQSSLLVPEDLLLQGSNRLTFEYQETAQPRQVDGSPDDRELAVMFDQLDLVPLLADSSFEMDATEGGWSFFRGWSKLEEIDGRNVRWSDGPESVLRFRLDPASGPYRLTLSALPFGPTMPQTLNVSLNGNALETLALAGYWQEYSLVVPEGVLKSEENLLTFAYGSTARPSEITGSVDIRSLGVLFDSIRLTPDDTP